MLRSQSSSMNAALPVVAQTNHRTQTNHPWMNALLI
ncbi:hypothetical protein FHS14_002001 [Paenibacillus baekrokdamisoli]|nr:hypothetical protein [Paenibacillus baekrokdamisoli]